MRCVLTLVTLIACLAAPASASAAAWLPSTNLGQQFQGPEMAVLPNGEIVVAWTNGGADAKVFAAIRPPGGPFGAPRVISEDSPDGVAMASNARGDVMVVWRDQDADGDLRAHFNLRPAGGNFASEGTELSPDGEDTADVKVALDPLGNALVVWVRAPNPGDFKLFSSFRPVGGAFGAPDEISPNPSTGPAVGVEPNGDAVVVWQGRNLNDPVRRALRPAGGSFGSEAAISASNGTDAFPVLTVDPAGNALAAWRQPFGGTNTRVQVAEKPAAGDFAFANFVSPAGEEHRARAIASDAQGNVFVTWDQDDPAQAQVAFRPAAGSFGSPVVLSDGDAEGPRGAFAGTGGALFAWAQGTTGTRARGIVRSPAGVFGPRLFVSPPNEDVLVVNDVGADGQGNGAALYQVAAGAQTDVRVAGYDAVPPRIDSTTVPARGNGGRRLTFSATAFDVWGPLTYTWRFGDGTTATGAQVTHSYPAVTATRQVQLTVTDAALQSATVSRTVNVRDATRPVVSRLRWTPAVFGAQSKRRKRVARGSRLRYSLSEAARVTARIQRSTVGRRVGRRCRKATRRLRTRRRCVRWVAVRGGVLRRRGKQGANSIRFNGKVRRRKLRTSKYRVAVRAVDAVGLGSRVKHARFRIVRRR